MKHVDDVRASPASAEDRAFDESPSTVRSLGQRLFASPPLLMAVVLLLLVGAFAILAPGAFFTLNNVRNIAVNASVLLLLAVGMTYVIITAGIDLSVGAILVLSGTVSMQAMLAAGGDGWGTILIGLGVALVVGGIAGTINGVLVAKAKLTPLIVTLATMGIGFGVARLTTGGVNLSGVPSTLVQSIGVGRVFGMPPLVIIALVVTIIAGIVLARTRFGLHTYAIGSNVEAARRTGVNVERHLIVVYALSGLCGGLAGYLSLARFATTTIGGHTMDNLTAITAVVLGGTSLFGGSGKISGTVSGALIPVVLTSGFVILGLPPFWQDVAVGIVLIAAVMTDRLRRERRDA